MRSLRHATVVLAVSALLATGLTSPAQAAIYTNAEIEGDNGFENQSAVACTYSNIVQSPSVSNVPIVENGPAATVTQSNSARLSRDSDLTDFIDLASNITAAAKMTSSGGNPARITMDAKGSVQAVASKGTSTCKTSVYSYTYAQSDFSVTNPGWFLYDYAASRWNYGEIHITRPDGEEFEVSNRQRAWKGSGRLFLDPGIYELYMETDAWIDLASATVPVTPVNVNLHLTYYKAGAALQKAQGKAKPYVKFPTARSCASHDLELTTKSKAPKASLIKLLVNGKVVKSIKNPKAGKKVSLVVADTDDAAVVARVTLKPTKKGGKPVTVESAASYLACA